jgi:hypothetical protein
MRCVRLGAWMVGIVSTGGCMSLHDHYALIDSNGAGELSFGVREVGALWAAGVAVFATLAVSIVALVLTMQWWRARRAIPRSHIRA